MPQPRLRLNRAPRAPRAPAARTIRAPRRLRLAPLRASSSVQLDQRATRPRGEDYELPATPYLEWREFLPWYDERWEAGDHVALVGMTKSGKTTLARQLLTLRDFVVVFGTKARDDALYEPLEAQGFVRKATWNPWEWEQTGERYVIFAPPLELADDPNPGEVRAALADQSDAFRAALVQLFKAGGWCCYFDEVRYLADDMGLARELNLLWLQGRSSGLTMMAATQRPRSVPLNMFEQATWTYLWRVSDREDRRTASEKTGILAPVVFETAAALPRNEFLCVNSVDDLIVRSRVRLPAAG